MSNFGAFSDANPTGLGPAMECKVCWYVYDPAEGDVVWQIPAGTPFAQLPPHWTCPNCSALPSQFLVQNDE